MMLLRTACVIPVKAITNLAENAAPWRPPAEKTESGNGLRFVRGKGFVKSLRSNLVNAASAVESRCGFAVVHAPGEIGQNARKGPANLVS